jgi:hypothetical protein
MEVEGGKGGFSGRQGLPMQQHRTWSLRPCPACTCHALPALTHPHRLPLPAAHVTEEALLRLTTSEFGSAPAECRLVGSSAPGLAAERRLSGALASSSASGGGGAAGGEGPPRRGAGGRGGGGDAYTEYMTQQRRAATGPRDCTRWAPASAGGSRRLLLRRDGPMCTPPCK